MCELNDDIKIITDKTWKIVEKQPQSCKIWYINDEYQAFVLSFVT